MVRVAHSIFNAEDLLATVQKVFEAPSFEACLFHRSFINDTYQLAAAGQFYYLRVYQAGWRTRSEAEAEMDAIEAVHKSGGAVARPVALRDGSFVTADLQALPAFLLIQRMWMASLHLNGHHRWGNIHFGSHYAIRLINWLRSWEIELDGEPDWLGSY